MSFMLKRDFHIRLGKAKLALDVFCLLRNRLLAQYTLQEIPSSNAHCTRFSLSDLITLTIPIVPASFPFPLFFVLTNHSAIVYCLWVFI